MAASIPSNFTFLHVHDEQLVRFGRLAERYFPDDPNTCLLKLRQFAELLAQMLASRVGLYTSSQEAQSDLLRRLRDRNVLPREIANHLYEVKDAGNQASHAGTGDHRTALTMLRVAWQLGLWYHRTFKDRAYKPGPFIPPVAPADESDALRTELEQLKRTLDEYRVAHEHTAQSLHDTQARLQSTQADQTFWEGMAAEAEAAKAALEQRLAELQIVASQQPPAQVDAVVSSAAQAATAFELDEADTRVIIDRQLRQTGWEADTANLKYSKGARPEKGRNQAIAEWPTANGPADYVLFIGLTPVAAIEAKRNNKDVSSALQQAKRYSRGFERSEELTPFGAPWGDFKLPFVFSSNARPYLKQLETRSGIWFCDVRRPTNLSRALDGWYTPERLKDVLKRDVEKAERQLAAEPFEYGFPLRGYQRTAIQAVERGVADGRQTMLLAMATGTGKTKTCIALIYRLLKTQRFSRVLFLVDRSALGEQATNAFKETRMENLRTFAEVFAIKELDEKAPDSDTAVHIATIQGMVKRVLFSAENETPPPVDRYDCIVVDECHRGYLLDRQLSDTELTFRGFEDYVSKYRRIIEYFDAVKIGLTATPALHTTQIFGAPIYTYSYREAVVDGFLIDHEPPIQIKTELSEEGIRWQKGEQIPVYDATKSQIDLVTAPDEVKLEIEDFNRKVVTESFNRVVCNYLAREIEPGGRQKTLIFCANDMHADLVVKLLKEAFRAQYGEVEDDAVEKITGTADQPLQLIRRYKNERLPNVAVTVDLLTTGIDVPEICNLVFIRRVNSRILFDQMLGRATRLCEEIGKDSFRVFDAVRLYEALGQLTAMQPVVTDPKISFAQLSQELNTVQQDDQRQVVLDQFIAKLQRKKHHLDEAALHDFETTAGVAPDQFIQQLRGMTLSQVAQWFIANPNLGEILDRRAIAHATLMISNHPDQLRLIERGYGRAKKPEDFLDEFNRFIRENRNRLPALTAVLTRPRELTRQQLRDLRLQLDAANFSEANLTIAWREKTNQDIAAGIVGFIRQAALGDPLLPYQERVDAAVKKLLASRPWSGPQRQWVQVIAEQTKANTIVDQAMIDDPALIFRTRGGGFPRLNTIFDGKLQQVLDEFKDSIWPPAA